MKYKTPASRAPGVASVGMMQAVSASSSRACSCVSTSSAVLPDFTAWCACSAADTSAGQFAVTHAAPNVPERSCRKSRRAELEEFMIPQQCKKFTGCACWRQDEKLRTQDRSVESGIQIGWQINAPAKRDSGIWRSAPPEVSCRLA